RNFDVQSRNGQHDSILRDRNPNRPKHDSRRYRRLLLQKLDDPVQSELGDGDYQEEKAERKQKRLKSSCSKTKQNGRNPPGHESNHAERQPDIVDRGTHPPPRVTTDQQRQNQQRRSDAKARLRIDSERFRILVFRILVFRIEVNKRRTQGKNQKDVSVSIVRQRQPQRHDQRMPPEQDRRSAQKNEGRNSISCRHVTSCVPD